MTPQERQRVTELFDRLATLETAPRDRDAESAIADGLARAPHAAYALVQTALVQDEALKRADARIRELEGAPLRRAAAPGGFLDTMRASVGDHTRDRAARCQRCDRGDADGRTIRLSESGRAAERHLSAGVSFARRLVSRHRGRGGGRRHWRRAAARWHPLDVRPWRRTIRRSRSAYGGDAHRRGADAGSAADSDLARQAGLDDIGRGRAATIRAPGHAASDVRQCRQ